MRMMSLMLGTALAVAASTTAVPAFAQDEEAAPAITVTGSATLISDYRFRGLSQTSGDPAVQGTVTVAHESGLYATVWASTIDGSAAPLLGYGDVEIDVVGGFAKRFGPVGIDVGATYYWYADRIDGSDTDFFEPYVKLNYAIGPVSTQIGAAYAWGGQDGLDFTRSNDDSLYLYFDAAAAIPSTPLTVKSHVGRTKGSLGLANPTSDDDYWDWSVTAEAKGGPFVVGVSYVDTDITNGGDFARFNNRGSTVLAYIGAGF